MAQRIGDQTAISISSACRSRVYHNILQRRWISVVKCRGAMVVFHSLAALIAKVRDLQIMWPAPPQLHLGLIPGWRLRGQSGAMCAAWLASSLAIVKWARPPLSPVVYSSINPCRWFGDNDRNRTGTQSATHVALSTTLVQLAVRYIIFLNLANDFPNSNQYDSLLSYALLVKFRLCTKSLKTRQLFKF